MSILITGLDMPKSCHECLLCIGGYCPTPICPAEEDGACPDQGRPNWCPLVPIPPHGDLIDRDAVVSWLYDDEPSPWKAPFRLCTADRSDVKFLLKNAPTIIPADENAKTEEDSEPWLCLSCRHYPPSSTDGKPCTQCNPSEVWHSCYDPAEEGE